MIGNLPRIADLFAPGVGWWLAERAKKQSGERASGGGARNQYQRVLSVQPTAPAARTCGRGVCGGK